MSLLFQFHSYRVCGALVGAYSAALTKAEIEFYVSFFRTPTYGSIRAKERTQQATRALLRVSHWRVRLPITR